MAGPSRGGGLKFEGVSMRAAVANPVVGAVRDGWRRRGLGHWCPRVKLLLFLFHM